MLAWTAARVTSWARTVSVFRFGIWRRVCQPASPAHSHPPSLMTALILCETDAAPPRRPTRRGGHPQAGRGWRHTRGDPARPDQLGSAGESSRCYSHPDTRRPHRIHPESRRTSSHARSVMSRRRAEEEGGYRLPAAGWSDESSCPASLRRATCTGLGWAADDGLMGRDPRVRDGCLRSYAHGTSGPSAHLAGRVNAVRSPTPPSNAHRCGAVDVHVLVVRFVLGVAWPVRLRVVHWRGVEPGARSNR